MEVLRTAGIDPAGFAQGRGSREPHSPGRRPSGPGAGRTGEARGLRRSEGRRTTAAPAAPAAPAGPAGNDPARTGRPARTRAELHILRAGLDGEIRRGTWLWLRVQGLKFRLQPGAYVLGPEIIWIEPTYHAVHDVLTHPAYAGAYTFGRSRQGKRLSDDGALRIRRRVLPQDEWEVLIQDHHPGFINCHRTLARTVPSTLVPARFSPVLAVRDQRLPEYRAGAVFRSTWGMNTSLTGGACQGSVKRSLLNAPQQTPSARSIQDAGNCAFS